ncbi:centrosomal protein of 126 kDa-like isoform X2 [Argopecten irradians]|uniref:centrosomal protein of 126 kDa-like isoform X2 n=1 Tax=Argopecten irradians TaxID=31199 RepID=UPI00371F2A13
MDDDTINDAKATMLTGAYSKQYRGMQSQRLEHLKQLEYDSKADSLARSKKLTYETNKRRRALAAKRRAEADREEKRRKLILSKRREQQREATERYQRSHVSSRPSSHTGGSTSPNRALEDTLRLVRGSLSRQNSTGSMGSISRQSSTLSGGSSGRSNNKDPLNRPYFNKYASPHHPPSPGDVHKISRPGKEAEKREKLHDKSLRNLSNSRSLFEQQLEHHQQLLVQDQQQSLYEFNNAIMQEIASDRKIQGEEDVDIGGMVHSESLDSVDSLEGSDSTPTGKGYGSAGRELEDEPANASEVVYDANQNLQDMKNFQHTNGDYNEQHYLNNQLNARNDLISNDQRTFYLETNARIESFNVDHVPYPPSSPRSASKSDTRPKVHVRAWATPSPVDQASARRNLVNSDASNMVTKNNPFAVRNTMTSVTTTTAYGKGMTPAVHSYAQSNAWTEEADSLQQQYTSNLQRTSNSNQPYVSAGMYSQANVPYTSDQSVTSAYQPRPVNSTCDSSGSKQVLQNGVSSNAVPPQTQPQPVYSKPTTTQLQHESGKNLDFLETVTNGMLEVTNDPPVSTPQTVSRLPRPVSATRTNAAPPSVSLPKPTPPVIVSSPQNGVQSSTRPPVCTVDTAATSTFGYVNGKVAVLPDHPAVQVRHVTYQTFRAEEPPSVVGIQRKAKDDSELAKSSKTKGDVEMSEGNGVQGILKRRPPSGGILKKAGSTGSMNKKFDVRDSLEVTRSHLQQDKNSPVNVPIKKKSVRFADHDLYEDEDEAEHTESDYLSRKPGYSKRPVSAKAVMQTTQAEPTGKPPRVASAGAHRTWIGPQKHKSTIRPQAAAHIITHNRTPTSGLNGTTDKTVTVTNNNFMSKVPVQNGNGSDVTVFNLARLNNAVASHKNERNSNHQQPSASLSPPSQGISASGKVYEAPVYDENGMRIDRTPTDDEINFLWDKVRTCLNRSSTTGQSTVVEAEKSIQSNEQHSSQPRQAATMSHTYIDGAALGQMYNTRVAPSQPHTQPFSNQNSYHRKPTSAADQASARRYGLLQQRRQHNPNSLGKAPASSPSREFITYHGPVMSNTEPQQGIAPSMPADASESMAAFVVAEQLTQQSLSDSQINMAMEDAQKRHQANNNARPDQKVPSALSIEEKRLLESLDRLNEKLKISEFPGNLPAQPSIPQAPPPHQFVYTNGFKGSKPLLSQQRGNSRGSSAVLRPTNIRF